MGGQNYGSPAEHWDFITHMHSAGDPTPVAAEVQVDAPPISVPGLVPLPSDAVYDWVIATAGAWPADRDPVDARIIADVEGGTGQIIASQADVGGWPALAENTHTLELPADPNGDDDGDGYTNLEEWLHQQAAAVE